MENVRLTQVKLLGMGDGDIDRLESLSSHERHELKTILKDYIKSHGLYSIQYSSSMVRIFKHKDKIQILDKMKVRRVPQRLLQGLSPSVINELSFLEEKEKQSLPKILEEYADDREFRELNNLITTQTNSKITGHKRSTGFKKTGT